jgi:hypothetical protein
MVASMRVRQGAAAQWGTREPGLMTDQGQARFWSLLGLSILATGGVGILAPCISRADATALFAVQNGAWSMKHGWARALWYGWSR